MIQLYQIAGQDFVLFPAEQPSGQAADVVRRLMPAYVVVRRMALGEARYHLYPAAEFLNPLTRAPGGQTLTEALGLNALPGVPALDAYQNADQAPDRCVVVDGGRVVGVHAVEHRAAIGFTRTEAGRGQEGGPARPAVTLRLQADFVGTLALGQTASLLVSLSRKLAGPQRGLPLAEPAGAQLDILVIPARGLALEGPAEGILTVTDEPETLPLQFKLRATEAGAVRVRVLCFRQGQPLGEIILAATVTASAPPEAARGRVGRLLAPLPAALPDLSLLISETHDAAGAAITFHLLAPDPALGVNFKPFGPIRLRLDPVRYFQEFFKDIEGLPLRTADDQAVAARKLALKGAYLFQSLLPPDLQALLWSLRGRIQSVQVLSDEPWIPWELLKLQGRENGRIEEGAFFCEQFALTRWFAGLGRRLTLRLNQLALVIPSDSGLPKTQDERAYLLSLNSAGRHVFEVPADYLSVIEALSRRAADAWHFAGHGQFSAADPNASSLRLQGGRRLTAEEICGAVANCGQTQPLVFLNACQTGRGAFSLAGVGGWAGRFVQAGAACFVGSLWLVGDEAAGRFAREFYERVLAGRPVGAAVRQARQAIRSPDDPTWLAYTVYADPLAALSPG